MCTNNRDWIPSRSANSSQRQLRSKSKAQIYRLTKRRCEEKGGKDMVLKNIKLYLENQSIIKENEKLRKKANLLHQENVALMSQLQNKFPHSNHISATVFLLLHKH